MAKMYPDDIEDYEEATEGERRVFRYLKEAARPHKDFISATQRYLGKVPDTEALRCIENLYA
jgi:hypothetical protein